MFNHSFTNSQPTNYSGEYQIGDAQARSLMVADKPSGIGTPDLAASYPNNTSRESNEYQVILFMKLGFDR